MQERPIEDLLWRRPNERATPNRIRSELYTRLAVPLYPLAFLVLTFAYLGAPRTTRQSRAMSLVNAILAATLVRGVGFVGSVSGPHSKGALIAPFIALAIAFVFGGIAIWRGLIIEPPAFITNALNAIGDGF
jgi:lipopolysaccharide export system permease protein